MKEKYTLGKDIYLNDSADSQFITFGLYGRSEQNGTPTPENPVDIEVAGESGSVEVKSVGKNLLEYPYQRTTSVINGIDFTDNGDGTITANGTATGLSVFYMKTVANSSFYLKKGNYILSGNPSGGTASTYKMRLEYGSNKIIGDDIGNGVNVNITSELSNEPLQLGIMIYSGQKVSNLTFKPMIRLASDTDSTYEPYKETASIITTENGLAGIPVDSGGNYTDQDGQQWICDEIVKYADGSGKRIRRIDSRTYDGVNNTCSFVNTSVAGGTETLVQFNLGISSDWLDADYSLQTIMCDKFTFFYYKNASSIFKYGIRQSYSNGIPCIYVGLEDGITDVATANAWLQENNVTVYYILKEPIITDLSAEEIAEIEKLYTFYPVTHIFNDAGCEMSITYLSAESAWIQPKTDWTSEDAFDYENYNRVTGNIDYLHEFANSLFGTLSDLSIEKNKVNLDLIHARHMNDIENGVEKINNETYRLNIGAKKTYKSNGHVPNYDDYNRIESATLNLYNQAESHQKNIPRLQYRLGNERGIRV